MDGTDEDRRLNELGYTQKLSRSVGGVSSFFLGFAVISATTAVFSGFGFGLATAGPAFVWTFPLAVAVFFIWALIAADLDVYAPCAMGGALSESSLAILTARVVAGAANNQLAHPGIGKLLTDRGIVYAPDYCINSGGVMQVDDERDRSGFSFDRARTRAARIYDTTLRVLERAATDGVPSADAADREAERRMRELGRRGQILVC